MRSIDSWFDRFCRKHPRLAIPNLMMYIVIGTAFVYILDQFGPFPISNYLAFDLYHIIHGQVWRLITFIFIPLNDNPFWFILSLYMYWWIGSAVEREWGSTKFTVFYGTGEMCIRDRPQLLGLGLPLLQQGAVSRQHQGEGHVGDLLEPLHRLQQVVVALVVGKTGGAQHDKPVLRDAQDRKSTRLNSSH